MVQKPKSVKYKVLTGYFLLFLIAVVSVWFVYTEILKNVAPARIDNDNAKIIQISNTVADLYASEAVGRNAILTGTTRDYNRYSGIIDSISATIDTIKEGVEENQVQKFDSIQLLLERKRNSINEIIQYRKNYSEDYRKAISRISVVKDSIVGRAKPIRISERNPTRELLTSLLTEQQLDSLSKFASNDTLLFAFEKVLADFDARKNAVQRQLFLKEQKLLDENQVISDQIRVILASVENEFLLKSYRQMQESQKAANQTAETMSWVGAISFLILIVFAWVIIRDLTSNQNYRQQLEMLNIENQDLLRSKSMLMATVTHDLQTPLGSIIGFYDLLKNSSINPKQQQYLNNIKESADYILKLVNDLLDFSKLENNRISIEERAFNMKTMIESTCMALEPIAVNKDIELNWDIDDELNSSFVSDPYRIKQVLTNLVSNSIKFTNRGSVEVTGKIENNKIIISVLDTGIGIARENHEDVFREFTQAHSGIEKKFGGTGLGLTISKKILELLGGDIMLESEVGQGSIFTVILPCIPSDEQEYVAKESSPADDIISYLSGKKILVVDDDNVQLTLMRELFANYPVLLKTEINSSEIINILQSEPFDLVITDIQMPIVDGFELIKQIRSHSNGTVAQIPVVALSGKRDLTKEIFAKAGFTAHHPKPIQFEQLLVLLSGIFGNKSLPKIDEPQVTGLMQLYNLKSLSQFTFNDPESLKAILLTFIKSADDNCSELEMAAIEDDEQRIAELAHKMIPMLKQMEVHSVAEMLIPLEERTLNLTKEARIAYIKEVCVKMKKLCESLKEEFS